MSLQQGKTESKQVSKRVQQTKKEIEQLKTELEKLISRGIYQDTNISSKTYDVEEVKPDTQIRKNVPNFTNIAQSTCSSNQSVYEKGLAKVATRTRYGRSPPRTPLKEPEPHRKKERHYNVEETREYIKKQKEKRLNMLKSQVKQSQSNVDIRKEKLKELQAKSLELVKRNIERKQEKFKSKENFSNKCPSNNSEEMLPIKKNHFDVPDLIINNMKHIEQNQLEISNQKHKTENLKNCHPQLENITIRNYELNPEEELKLQSPKQNLKYDFRQRAAAVKIQSMYRGYRQRKLYKVAIDAKIKETNSQRILSAEAINVKPIKDDFKKISATLINEKSVRGNSENCRIEIPFWLQTVTKPHPYSFMNAVKKKLNFSINSPSKTYCDVAVQNSINETEETVLNQEVKTLKPVETSAQASLSHKHLKLNLENIERLQLQMKSDANNCDIDKNSIKKSKSESSMPTIQVSKSSDSDTSKNIPDISNESIDNLCSSNAGSNSNFSVGINVNKLEGLKLKEKLAHFNVLNNNNVQKDLHSNIASGRNTAAKKFEEYANTKLNFISLGDDAMSSKISENIVISQLKDEKKSALYSDSQNSFHISEGSHKNIVDKVRSSSNSTKLKHLSITSQDKKIQSSVVTTKLSQEKSNSKYDKNNFILKNHNERTQIKTRDSHQTDNSEENYSINFSNSILSSVPSLKCPVDTLTTSRQSYAISTQKTEKPEVKESVINIQPGEVTSFETKANTNQIHLKFEAELHLLNDFNESLRQFMAVEKSLLELQSKSQNNIITYQHQDTQTSAPLPSQTETKRVNYDARKKLMPSINYSRGSEITEEMSAFNLSNSFLHSAEKSLLKSDMELSEVENSVNSTINRTNGSNVFVGLSLEMFDQLIKDEDSRIENLKTILKIREKSLLDRTKGELTWLEIQKKQLIETGKLYEASLLKKKQRGIIIKLQHEKQEMQKLKQMQKAASKERKIILKKQRSLIKAQLSNADVVTKIKKNVRSSKQTNGPVKVYNLHTEAVNTETSISRRSSFVEELILTSRTASTVSRISDHTTDFEYVHHNTSMKRHFPQKTEHAKKFLLMREAALQKRRKAAEELLQWHQRLLEEERKIAELEMAASAIINQVTIENEKNISKENYMTKDSSWLKMKKTESKIKIEDAAATRALEQIYKNATQLSKINGDFVNNKTSDSSESALSNVESDSNIKSQNSAKTVKSVESIETEKLPAHESSIKELLTENQSNTTYTSEFESLDTAEKSVSEKSVNISSTYQDVQVNENDKSKSSLHEIIQNISNISDEISAIYKLSCANSENKSNNNLELFSVASINDQSKEGQDNDVSLNESNHLQSQIIKSLTELIIPETSCQDVGSLREHSIIETPEAIEPKNKLNESQNILASSSELQTNLLEIQTEDSNKTDFNSQFPTNDVKNIMEYNVNENKDDQSDCTINSDLSSLNKPEDNQHMSIKSENIIVTGSNKSSTNSVQCAQVVLDLSYGFIPSEENSRSISEKTSIVDENHSIKSASEGLQKQSYSVKNKDEVILNTQEDNVFNVDSTSNIEVDSEITDKEDKEVSEILSINFLDQVAIAIEEVVTDPFQNVPEIIESNSSQLSGEKEAENFVKSNNSANSHTETIINEINASEIEETLDNEHIDTIYNEENVNFNVEIVRNNFENKLDHYNNMKIENLNNGHIEHANSVEEITEMPIVEKTTDVTQKKSFNEGVIDVKKRVSEILADANNSLREDKSPRLQDIYITTYDVTSPDNSPEAGSPVDGERSLTQLFGEEAEALLKKQLAIEQEIKQLEQQQKQQQIPYLYLREIPNKPPPPYTPPSAAQLQNTHSALPHNPEEVTILTSNIADVLHEAYSGGYLESSCASQNNINKSNIDKECYEFVFDLCKELTIDHYKQFIRDDRVSWLKVVKKSQLACNKPFDKFQLKQYLEKNIKELLGFEKTHFKENAIIKWSRKKRDHVDELLVLESQIEEPEWTNYDEDEIIVKNEVTNDILNMLLQETADVMSTILRKSTFLY